MRDNVRRRFFAGEKRWRKLALLTTMALAMLLAGMVLHAGCASARLEVRGAPLRPFDAIIVPGCPSRLDGSVSRCQARRAMWAAILWERGYAHHFITSGAAVTSPFIEAEALAEAMTLFGVPAERIYLEPGALHTDENIYNALQIARLAGWSRLAIASDVNQAVGACQMLEDWHPQCGAFSMDYGLVESRLIEHQPRLSTLRTQVVNSFMPLKQREQARARHSGRSPRPPSFVVYTQMFLRKAFGKTPWQPFLPESPAQLVTWDAALKSRQPSP